MLRHRHPGLWVPQRKPTGLRQTYQLDPVGRLSRGLLMAVIPDGPLGTGSLIDFVRARTWATPSGTPTFSTGQYGVQWNDGFSGTNQLTFTPTVTDPGAVFSISVLVQTDGSDHGGFNNSLISATTVTTEFAMAHAANGVWRCGNLVNGVDSSVITMASLTGWHRLGISTNGTNARFFLDGKFTDTQAVGSTIANGNASDLTGALTSGNSSWGWNTADFFFWNRALSDTEMALNWSQPYQSVLTPRFGELHPGISVASDLPPFVPSRRLGAQLQQVA